MGVQGQACAPSPHHLHTLTHMCTFTHTQTLLRWCYTIGLTLQAADIWAIYRWLDHMSCHHLLLGDLTAVTDQYHWFQLQSLPLSPLKPIQWHPALTSHGDLPNNLAALLNHLRKNQTHILGATCSQVCINKALSTSLFPYLKWERWGSE